MYMNNILLFTLSFSFMTNTNQRQNLKQIKKKVIKGKAYYKVADILTERKTWMYFLKCCMGQGNKGVKQR